MHYLSETYTAKPAWLALTHADRNHLLETILAGMAQLGDSGITVLAMGQADGAQADMSDETAPKFFALWELRDRAAQQLLLSAIAATGWHDYFDTTILAGPAVSVKAHLHQLQTLA